MRAKTSPHTLHKMRMINNKTIASAFWEKNKHGLCMLYFLIYLPWFAYLEKTVTTHFHTIYMSVDDYIPFCEYFVIPYFLWFFYVAFGFLYFFQKDKGEYLKLCQMLFAGMTLFLIVSTIYPNGHCLRPATFARDNFCVDLVKWLYQTDTPTNLFPSIHVYNSIGVNAAIWHCDNFKNNKPVRYASAILMVSIVLSTVLLKQHSLFDLITGVLAALSIYRLVYGADMLHLPMREPRYNRKLKRI